jgi:hypothetical protein
MRSLPALLAVTAVLALTASVHAGPDDTAIDPEPTRKFALDRLLPADTYFVGLVDVKAIRSSALFTNHLKKDVEKLLKRREVADFFSSVGADPLKDIDRVIVFMSPGCWGDNFREEGPCFLLQGRFNQAKVRAGLGKMGKLVDLGKKKAYALERVFGPVTSYAALLQADTVMWCVQKQMMTDALSRAGKPAKWKLKSFAEAVKKIDGKQALQSVGVREMIVNASYRQQKGAPAQRTLESLGDNGFSGFHLSATVKETAKGAMVFTLADKTQGAAKEKVFKAGQEEIVREGERHSKREPGIKPLLEAVRKATIRSKDAKLTIEAQADPDVVRAILATILRGPF